MPSFKLEENLVIITYKGGVVMLQRDLIVGFHLRPDPDTIDIILKKNTVSMLLGGDGTEAVANGWAEVLKGLKELVTVVTRTRN